LFYPFFRCDQALSLAISSLQHDPTFKKSILRRALANVELKNFEDALPDLRSLFKDEPSNMTIVNLMRKIKMNLKGEEKMSPQMISAFVGHHVRRGLTRFNPISAFKHASQVIYGKYLMRTTVS
jgi:predicted Zn-dependent protease